MTTLSKVYKYQTVCEILTLEKRNNMKKRYTNEILHGIYLCLGVTGTTTSKARVSLPTINVLIIGT